LIRIISGFIDRVGLADTWNKPPIAGTSTQYSIFIVVHWILILIGLTGLWYAWGIYYAIGALIIKMALSRIVFDYFYKQVYRAYCWQYLPMVQKSYKERGEEASEISMKVDAQRMAKERIRKNMHYEL
jgi:hypothetical protein